MIAHIPERFCTLKYFILLPTLQFINLHEKYLPSPDLKCPKLPDLSLLLSLSLSLSRCLPLLLDSIFRSPHNAGPLQVM